MNYTPRNTLTTFEKKVLRETHTKGNAHALHRGNLTEGNEFALDK